MGIALSTISAGAQHGHLNAGALGTQQNDKLYFANGADFVDSSGYVKTLTFTNGGRFAGYYQGNITLTSLPATPEHAGPDPAAAAPGSFLQFNMALLAGPEGGSFGFWENGSTSPTLSLLAGQSNSTLFPVSEGDGSPGSDPFGHRHGRRFTATKAGVYKIAFQVVDTSTNGAGSGPIHAPSDPLPVYFQAGINIVSVTRTGLVSTIRYGSLMNNLHLLEYMTNVSNAVWLPLDAPQSGTDHFLEVQDRAATNTHKFYRINSQEMIP